MKKLFIVFALALVFSVSQVFAQRTVTIRMASPVPENTPWGRMFNELSEDFRRITNGQVELIVFHGGVAGNEKDVVRNLRLNQLQAAVLSTLGLFEIAPEVLTLSCPFLIRDDYELDLVLNDIRGELEQRINRQGFHTLAWARIGWIRFFSRQPIYVPDDLRRQRLGTNADQAELNQVFRAMGFQMIPVAQHDILIALNSNMVDAVFSSLAAVGGSQVFGLARNMSSLNVAPFVGAIVFNQRAWRSIPAQFRPQLMEVTRRREAALDRDIRQLEAELIRMMEGHGLIVNHASPEQEELWFDEIGRVMPSLVGTLFDREIHGRIEAVLQQHRRRRT